MKFFRTLAAVTGLVFVLSGHQALAATNKTISSVDTPGGAGNLTIADNYAYVSDGLSGLSVLDITNSSAPTYLRSIALPDLSGTVVVNGTVLFVADNTTVKILSLAAPATPAVVGTYTQSGLLVTDVAVDGNNLYVLGTVNGTSTLEIVNVANVAAPSLLNSITVNGARSITVAGTQAIVAGGNKIDIINISSAPVMTIQGSFTDSKASAFHGVEVFGSIAYLNDESTGMHAVSIAQPTAMTDIFTASTGPGYGIAISNGYVFAPIGVGGLAVYDIVAQAGTPVYVDTFSTTTTTGPVTVAGDVAYVSEGFSGVELLDVSKPDTVPPVITISGPGAAGSAPQVITIGGKFVDPGASGFDNIDGQLTITVSGTVDTSTVGKYVLTYTATDRAGNITTATRTVIIAPSIVAITGKNNIYTQKVNGKTLTIRNPLPSYVGTVVARKLIVHKLTDPMFLFVATSPYGKSAMVVYNYQGKVLSRVDLTKLSINGLHLDLMSDPSTLSVVIALNPTVAGTTVRMFTISKIGLKSAGNVLVSTKPVLIVEKLLKFYTNEVGLATMAKGKTSTIRMWRYSTKTKTFVRDAAYLLSKLALTGTSIKLK